MVPCDRHPLAKSAVREPAMSAWQPGQSFVPFSPGAPKSFAPVRGWSRGLCCPPFVCCLQTWPIAGGGTTVRRNMMMSHHWLLTLSPCAANSPRLVSAFFAGYYPFRAEVTMGTRQQVQGVLPLSTGKKVQVPSKVHANTEQSLLQCWHVKVKFGMKNRRHHCRLCGQVCCGDCSGRRHPKYPDTRICTPCYSMIMVSNGPLIDNMCPMRSYLYLPLRGTAATYSL